jgi:hypothetical protein
MLRFADDTVIIAQDEINLKRALESLVDILKSKYKMKINRIKIEIVVYSKDAENINIIMDDIAIKQVPKFKYLSSIFTEEGKIKEHIIRDKEAKDMFNNKKQLQCSNNHSWEIKKKLIKSCICSVGLYG